jgi:hypothetical protein
MSVKQRSGITQWWPAFVFGAGIAETIYLFMVWQGISKWFWYGSVFMPLAGGVLGLSLSRCVYGVYKSLCAGRWIHILFWTIFSAFLCIMIGMLVKHFLPNDFQAILPENMTAACLIWGAVGVAFAMLGLGEEYLD